MFDVEAGSSIASFETVVSWETIDACRLTVKSGETDDGDGLAAVLIPKD
jgi:hypothetical protein